jgi:hypothetical protein
MNVYSEYDCMSMYMYVSACHSNDSIPLKFTATMLPARIICACLCLYSIYLKLCACIACCIYLHVLYVCVCTFMCAYNSHVLHFCLCVHSIQCM